MKVVQIATDADGEYVAALGGTAAANNDILSTLNQVDGIYQRDIGLTFTITFQNAWPDAATDIYTAPSGNFNAMINEFKDKWNATFPNVQRDVAHLWTGRSLGGPDGIAFTGTVCLNPPFSYGMSIQETLALFKVSIPAHELGHNFGAHHSDPQAGCANTIMQSVANQSNSLVFCQFSIDEITAFVTANSTCLTDAAGNPIDQAQFFVRQHYLDFLNRQPDQSGLDFWTNNINSCGADQNCIAAKRVYTSAAFFFSIEFQQTGYLVERVYKTAYGNFNGRSTFNGVHNLPVPIVKFADFIPDTTQIGSGVTVGAPGWEAALEQNKQNFMAGFVTRQRFVQAYPASMPNSTFVNMLNSNAGSPLSGAEATQLANSGVTRAQMLRTIAEHQNLVNSEFNRAFVLMQYFGYLRRDPDGAPDSDHTGYDFWLTKMIQFNGNYQSAEMVKAFITSIEYRRRFGTP